MGNTPYHSGGSEDTDDLLCPTFCLPCQVNGDGSEAERGRTRPISGSLQPVWINPAEVFILTAVEEIILEVRGERKKNLLQLKREMKMHY